MSSFNSSVERGLEEEEEEEKEEAGGGVGGWGVVFSSRRFSESTCVSSWAHDG